MPLFCVPFMSHFVTSAPGVSLTSPVVRHGTHNALVIDRSR